MKQLDNLYVSELEFEESGMRGEKGESGDAPSLRIRKIAPYLYTADYNDVDYDAGEVFVRKSYPEAESACAAIAIEGSPFFGHNYDAPYDDTAEVVVRMSARLGRHASVATCVIPGVLTTEMMDAKDESDDTKAAYDALPMFAIDGVNDAGVAVAINRMPTEDSDDIADDSGMCALFAARYVLDNAHSAMHAAELLDEKTFWFSSNDAIKAGFYLLIYDKTRAILSDLNGNKIIYENSSYPLLPVSTNFRNISWDGTDETLEKYANGVERHKILLDDYESISSEDDLLDALKSIRYTEVYDHGQIDLWYSDYNGDWSALGLGELTVDTAHEDYARVVTYCTNLFANRERDGRTMHTVHTAVYDVDKLTLTMLVQEEDQAYHFCMNEMNLLFDEVERAKAAEQSIRDDFANSFYYKSEVDDALLDMKDDIIEEIAEGHYSKEETDELINSLHTTISGETDTKLETKADAADNDGADGQVLYKTEHGTEWGDLPPKLPEVTASENGYVMAVENGEWVATDKFADYIRYVNITVSIVSDNGGVPTSGIVVTITNDDTGDVINQANYTGQPITFRVPRGLEYKIEQSGRWEGYHNPTPAKIEGVANNDTSCVFTYEAIRVPETLRELQIIVDSGSAESLKDHIGLQFDDTYTQDGVAYNIIWDLKDVHTVYDMDGNAHTGVILEWHYATNESLPFDAPERLQVDLTTTTVAEAGLYYYGLSGSTYKLLSLNAGDELPRDYDAIYVNTIRSADASILRRGYGRYAHSVIRKWLNSDASAGEWFTPSHVGDVAPEQADTIPGFMAGCSAQILSMAKPVRVRTAISADDTTDTYDTFFIPSVSEVNGFANVAQEGDPWEDWVEATNYAEPNDDACSGRRVYPIGGGGAQVIGLRTANIGYQYIAWNIKADGSVDGYTAASTQRKYTPCCAIYR